MNQTHKKYGAAGLLALCILAALFIIQWPNNASESGTDAATSTGSVEDTAATINALILNKAGEYTIAGEVETPTPCYTLTAEADASDENNVALKIATEENEGACAQVISSRSFRVEFEANEIAVITATLNGEPVSLNLVPVASKNALENELGKLDIKG